MAKKKKSTNVSIIRNTILGVAGLLALAAAGYFAYVFTGLDEGEIIAGTDYELVENARPPRPGAPIEVIEYFSYGCIHCKTFDPVVEKWAKGKGDAISFKRAPTVFSPSLILLAQTYFTLEETGALDKNHTRLFRAIHDSRRQFLSPQAMADYVDGRDVTAEEFTRVFKSPDVRNAMRRATRDQEHYRIRATPSMVVAGKYVVSMTGGQARALSVVDHLLDLETVPAEEAL